MIQTPLPWAASVAARACAPSRSPPRPPRCAAEGRGPPSGGSTVDGLGAAAKGRSAIKESGEPSAPSDRGQEFAHPPLMESGPMIVNLREAELFVEGLKMRPTAECVLAAITHCGATPSVFQKGATIESIAAATGLSCHVVRARLCDLRRLGLVESDRVRITDRATDPNRKYAHFLTPEGERRIVSIV